MRRLPTAILLVGWLVAPAWAQWTVDAQKCAETTDANLAFDLCTRAIQSGALSGPALAMTFNNRGNAYQSKNEFQRAIQDYDEAIRIDPDSALAFNNRGSAFQHMGNYDRAIQDYDQAIRLDGTSAFAYNNRGRVYHLKEDYQQAIKDYGQAIEADPDYPLAFYNRGLARFDQGLYIAAVPDFVRAVQLDPAKPYRVIALYMAKARAGDPDKEMLAASATQLKLDQWPGPVVNLLLDKTTPQAVIDATRDPDPQVQRERQCEAYFYIGEYLLIHDQRAEAARMLQAAAATGLNSLFEYSSAKAELRNLAKQ
ncbi:MAG TPA: tetratricopeptide repeat protein [Candidatus Bathyarchaeia archaeon]|nr:tetratricopeptide repeat protein [Candidatus Bathyarchaeia archaeon]